MGHEDHRAAGLLPDLQELQVETLPRHLVERAEGLVHQQEGRVERERTCDRDPLLHPARELPGPARLEPAELHQLEHLLHASLPSRPAPTEHLERQRHVLRHGAPVVEHGILKHDPVVVVEPRPMRRLAVHEHAARARLDEVADDAQDGRLAAAGGADQRNELTRLDLEVDVHERSRPGPKRLRHAADGDRLRSRVHAHTTFSGARRTTRCSAMTTRPKKTRPIAAQTMFVAHRNVGCSE